MAKAVVINISGTTKHLHTHEGDSVTVLSSNKSVAIDAKFVQWIPPHPSEIQILYYIDDKGNRVKELPDPATLTNNATPEPVAPPEPIMAAERKE
jgi:hypothetical protein